MPGPPRRVAGARRRTAPAAAPAPAPRPTAPGATAGEPLLLVVGRVGKPQGIKGEVTVEVRTDDPDARFAVGTALLTEPPERGPLVVEAVRDHSGRLVVRFAGVPDRNAAELLRDTLLQVDAAGVPPIDDPDEFHDFELVGLRADLEDGTAVGEVREVLHLPHGDVLAVTRPEGAELLVPFVRAMVPVVDVAGGRVVLVPPEGLLELDA